MRDVSIIYVSCYMSKRFCCDHIFFHREPGLNAARFWFHAVPTGFTSVALRKPHLPVHFPYNQVYSWDWSGSHFLGMFLELPFTSWGHGYSSSQGLPSILVICTRESSSQTWKFWTTKNARFPTWEKEEHETYGFIWFACGSMCLVRFMFHLPVPWSSGHFTWSQWPTVTFTGLSCSLGQDIEKWKIRAYPLWNPDLLKMDAWGSFIYLL